MYKFTPEYIFGERRGWQITCGTLAPEGNPNVNIGWAIRAIQNIQGGQEFFLLQDGTWGPKGRIYPDHYMAIDAYYSTPHLPVP